MPPRLKKPTWNQVQKVLVRGESTELIGLTSVCGEMANLLYGEGRELSPRFRERIQKLADYSGRIGWGYGDFLSDQAFELDGQLLEEFDDK